MLDWKEIIQITGSELSLPDLLRKIDIEVVIPLKSELYTKSELLKDIKILLDTHSKPL